MANLKDLIVNGSARILGTLYADDIRDNNRITEFIIGTQTAATGSWVGVTKDHSLYDGKNINYFLPYAGSGNASLNLTLADGTTTGAKPIYLWGTSYVTTQYPANSCVNMTYNSSKGAWFVNADRDANDNTYDRVKNSNNIYARGACTAGKLICGANNGYKDIASGVTFNLDYPLLYCGTAIANAATGNNTYFAFPGVNLQTIKSNWTGTQWSAAYLVGTLSGKVFTIDSSIFTTTVPSTADGKVYMPIGVLYSAYQLYFNPSPVLYAYINGSFQQLQQTIKQDGITGNTVNRFATCSIGASTAAKTASITSGTFSLENGTRVTVYFTNQNTASNPTLNINSTGAKNIYIAGTKITTGDNKGALKGACEFVYRADSPTGWHLVGHNGGVSYSYSNGTLTITQY